MPLDIKIPASDLKPLALDMKNQRIFAKESGKDSKLGIPREDRDMIYSLVLQAAYAEKRLPEPSERFNLLRTCSQASEEAAQGLYQEKIFRFAAHPLMDSALPYQKTVDA